MDTLKLNFFWFPYTRVPNVSHESSMGEQCESDLNLLQLQRVQDIDIDQLVVSFIKKNPKRLCARSILSDLGLRSCIYWLRSHETMYQQPLMSSV